MHPSAPCRLRRGAQQVAAAAAAAGQQLALHQQKQQLAAATVDLTCNGRPPQHQPQQRHQRGGARRQQQRATLCPDAVREAALTRYLQRVAAAAAPGAGHARLHHYFVSVRPSCLTPDGYSLPAYITEVRERQRRLGLAELRSGVHWGLEERERLLGRAMRPRTERHCLHCEAAGQPDLVEHDFFLCPVRQPACCPPFPFPTRR